MNFNLADMFCLGCRFDLLLCQCGNENKDYKCEDCDDNIFHLYCDFSFARKAKKRNSDSEKEGN